MARKSKTRKRQEKKVYAIIVDGETEVWYFNMMRRHEKMPRIDIRPELPKRKKLKEQYDKVTEFLDLDAYEKIIWLLDFDTLIKEDKAKKKGSKSAIQEFKEYKFKLEKYNTEKREKVKVLVNTPCLEFWHLLHFEASGKFFPKCEDASRILKKHLPKYQKTRNYYTKQDNDIYIQLKPHLAKGISNAEKLGELDFDLPQSAKAEIYKVFDILNII